MARSRTTDGTAALAAKMLRVLEAQRGLGDPSYPLTLKRLAELTDPAATPALVHKAAARKEFAGQVIIAHKKSLDAPLALADDLDELTGSRLLLEFVLESVCTPAQPGWPLGKLKTKVPPALKGPFEQAVRRQIREQSLPPSIGFVQVGRTPYLYLQRMPYKPPALALADRMLAVLERRGSDGTPYPLPVQQLAALADPEAPAALVKKALAEGVFQQRAVGALAKLSPEAPVALADDLGQLADSPLVLETLLRLEASGRRLRPLGPSSDRVRPVACRLGRPHRLLGALPLFPLRLHGLSDRCGRRRGPAGGPVAGG